MLDPVKPTRAAMSDQDKRNGTEGPNTGVIVKAKPKTKKPSMYKVLMLNDDYTPMEFVVHILERFFNRPAKRRPASCCTSIAEVSGYAECLHTRWLRPK